MLKFNTAVLLIFFSFPFNNLVVYVHDVLTSSWCSVETSYNWYHLDINIFLYKKTPHWNYGPERGTGMCIRINRTSQGEFRCNRYHIDISIYSFIIFKKSPQWKYMDERERGPGMCMRISHTSQGVFRCTPCPRKPQLTSNKQRLTHCQPHRLYLVIWI